ncbi:MAG TPA: hypothetical protein GX525_11950 [Bacilli bacterium]|nr:hypothetical protein [Bacilli bacterium]
MSDELLEKILLKLERMEESNKQEFFQLNQKVEAIDKKIDTIYTQVANNTEHQTMVEQELQDIKRQSTFNTFKIAENEKELFFIKKNKQ